MYMTAPERPMKAHDFIATNATILCAVVLSAKKLDVWGILERT